MASRGMVNDNFAYEVWDLGSHYPFQETAPALPEIEVTAEDLRLNQKQIRFYRRFRTFRRRLVPVPLKKGLLRRKRRNTKSTGTAGISVPIPRKISGWRVWGIMSRKRSGGFCPRNRSGWSPFLPPCWTVWISGKPCVRWWNKKILCPGRDPGPGPGGIGGFYFS